MMEIKIEKTSDEYYYCKKCKREFTFDECKQDGAPISGVYYVSPCCNKDIHCDDNIEQREKNIKTKKWVAVDDMREWLKQEIHRSGSSSQMLEEFDKETISKKPKEE